MLPPRHVVATDLDGTLLRTDRTVSAATQAALSAAATAGVQVVFVTGRPPQFLPDIARITGMTGPAICANGAMVVQLPDLSASYVAGFSAEAGHSALSALARYQGDLDVRIMMTHADLGHTRKLGSPQELRSVLTNHVHAGWQLVKIATVDHQHDLPAAFVTEIAELIGDQGDTTHSAAELPMAEVAPAGVNKGTTLCRFATEIGVDMSRVHAIGDMPNDISMLTAAGQSYAVANAHPDIKRVVQQVLARTNDEDAVADLIWQVINS